MSITTLKKKHSAIYNKGNTSYNNGSTSTLQKKHSAMYHISGGTGFSLNNSRRIDSHSHQQRSQTSMKGTAYRGHGKGNFNNVVPIKSSYVNYDPHNTGSISVKNTKGMLSTRFKWINRPFPFSTTQDMTTPDYETFYARKVSQLNKPDICKVEIDKSGNCGTATCFKTHNFVKKPQTDYATYYRTKFLNKNNIPVPPKLESYPPRVSNSRHCCAGFETPFSYSNFIQRLKC